MAIGLLFDFINAKTPNVNQTPNTWVEAMPLMKSPNY
jgi:hypothetical protein